MNTKLFGKILIIVCVLLVVVYATKDASYPHPYEVINNTDKILMSEKKDFSGATMVNLDDDDEQEIFISGHGTNNLLLKRKEDKFFEMQIPELLDPHGLTFSVTACDLDGDGRDEILMLNRPDLKENKSHSRVVRYSKGKWEDLLTQTDPLTESLRFGYSSTCLDRKGDGHYGLAVTSENGKISYLEMSEGKIQDIAASIGIALSSKGRSILAIPSSTGPMNIFVGNEEGANFYFVNRGDGTFTEKAKEVGLDDPDFNARGMSLMDLNHDDLPDVIYGNNLGPVHLLEQEFDGKFKDKTPELMKNAYAVNSPVVGDFNSDGFEDIYLNNIRGSNRLYARYQEEWFEIGLDEMAEKEMFGISTIAGDLDHNGSFDLLNTHGDGSPFPVTFYSVRPVYDWIKFSVTFENGGIPRGAILKLRSSVRDHIRVISPGSGRFANYDNQIHFGLEKNESVLFLEVILPSGKRLEFKEPYKHMQTHDLKVRLSK